MCLKTSIETNEKGSIEAVQRRTSLQGCHDIHRSLLVGHTRANCPWDGSMTPSEYHQCVASKAVELLSDTFDCIHKNEVLMALAENHQCQKYAGE